jgi:hypothetical protein
MHHFDAEAGMPRFEEKKIILNKPKMRSNYVNRGNMADRNNRGT